MTAEVAILNQTAVALAADSAVTIGQGTRVFETANKVFTLSKYAPVGVMVYGSATLQSLPWETLIKLFRRDLRRTRFPRLEEYADAVFRFLSGHVTWIPAQQQAETVRAAGTVVLEAIAANAAPGLAARSRAQGSISATEHASLVSQANIAQNTLRAAARLATLSPNFERNFQALYAGLLVQVRQGVFGTTPLGASLETVLDDIVQLRFTQEFFGDDQSGIVIAGFGEDELLPALRSYTVEYVVADELRLSRGQSVNVGLVADQSAFVLPFAQSDEMLSFVMGSTPALNTQYRNAVDNRLRAFATDLLTAVGVSAAQQQAAQAW